MLLVPRDRDFPARVDAILNDHAGLEAFFRRSLFVTTKLKAVLYPAAFKGVALPKFPASMKPLSVTTTGVDNRLRRILDGYSAAGR
jgi:hypothetical protein